MALVTNPTAFSWTDPTTNTDGSPITAGEVSGYTIGVRNTAAAGSVAGTYSVLVTDASATAVNLLLTAITPALGAGSYAAAIRTNSANGNSVWSAEQQFAIVPPPPIPNAPTNFSIG